MIAAFSFDQFERRLLPLVLYSVEITLISYFFDNVNGNNA
jgi:hypothetical protein